jgi:uncharacterized BrkB/YihY/UPF0761 family membrane protein
VNEKYFRYLLILYVVCTLAAFIAALIPGGYSQALSDAYSNEPLPWDWNTQNIWIVLAVALPLLAAAVAGVIGLYRFERWGRTLSLYMTGVSPILNLFFETSMLLWGAILALSYYSALSSRFNVNR